MRRALFLALLVACHGGASTPSISAHRRWLVLAPHPDDETLIASGVIARARAEGDEISVAVMTNGDFDCIHDGILREGESVAGMAALGLPEDRVRFLGYPDGGLPRLGRTPLPSKRLENGRCVIGTTTYGARGHGHADVHTKRTGHPANYTREDAVGDLVALLSELEPDDVFVTHPSDTHPDHATTYAFLRSAIDRLARAPRIHRALVHNGDCWPTGTAPHEPCPVAQVAVDQPVPPLSGRLRGYEPAERLPVPASCRVADRSTNAKLRAIAAHASQTRQNPESYLFSFARADEAFFPETFTRGTDRWQRKPLRAERRDVSASLRKDAKALDAGVYRLEVDTTAMGAMTATLRKSGASEPLEVWPLAHDLFSEANEESFGLEVDPRPEDGAVEITLRVRGEVTGMAIDVSR